MRVWNGIEAYPAGSEPVVATVGNYDGVHLGHRAILEGALGDARRRGLKSLLVTFDPHPVSVVAPERRPRLLQTRRQKLDSLEATGLDGVLILRFDEELAALSGQTFFSEVLSGPVHLAAIHVGSNFHFGRDRSGNLELMREIGRQRGFDVVGVDPVRKNGTIVSSSVIRRAVQDGDIDLAARLLGRPYSVTGEIVQGDGRGKELDFPTANLDVENEIIPERGVYVTETAVLATRHTSVSNVGVRPTFEGKNLTVETHLLEFEGDLYGERAEVRFLARLRDEQRFSSPEELADQIARDRAAAESYFRNQQPRSQ
jgi:riboflavin kinase/FMN adenylyltransferase